MPWQQQPYKVTATTIERCLSIYRRQGLAGLQTRQRSDAGGIRAIDTLLARRICAIKEQSRQSSIPVLIQALEYAGEAPIGLLKHSTVHRLLQRQGLSGRPGKDPGGKQQRLPFRASNPMDLWVGDVMHGRVSIGGQNRISLHLWITIHGRLFMPPLPSMKAP